MLQQRVYGTLVADLDELKRRLRAEWAKMHHLTTVAAMHQWRRRLTACGDRGQFEHRF